MKYILNKLEKKNANYSKVFLQYDNLIYTIFAISIVSSLYIYLGSVKKENIIANFSLASVSIFLLMHLFSIGYEQFIYSNKSKLCKNDKVLFDKCVFIPIFFVISLYFVNLESVLPFKLNTEIILFEKKIQIKEYSLICLTVFFGIYAKIFASIFIILEKIHISNSLYLFKAIGLLIGSILFYLKLTNSIILALLLSEFIAFIFLFYNVQSRIKYSKLIIFDRNYIFSSINVFGFDFIMKADLMLLAYFLDPKIVAFYTIGSSVFEGFIQFISSFKYKIIKNIHLNNIDGVKAIFYFLIKLCFLFFPAYICFDYLSLNSQIFELFKLALILQLSLVCGCFGVLVYNLLEIDGKPKKLCLLSITLLLTNLAIGYILIPIVGVLGASIGSLVSFSCLTIYYLNYTRKKNVWNNSLL